MRIGVLLALLALSACVDQHALRCCTGQVFTLNTGHWQPTAAESAAAQKMATAP